MKIIDKINTEIIPFMEKCISKDEIHHFNILGFSKGDVNWYDNRYFGHFDTVKQLSLQNSSIRLIHTVCLCNQFLFFLDPDDWLPDNNVFKDMYDTAKENHVLTDKKYGVFEKFV